MTVYRWWDTEEHEESDGTEFTAENFEDAKYKAAWMFMGVIGCQHEYDAPIAILNKETNEIRRFAVCIEMEPSFFFDSPDSDCGACHSWGNNPVVVDGKCAICDRTESEIKKDHGRFMLDEDELQVRKDDPSRIY